LEALLGKGLGALQFKQRIIVWYVLLKKRKDMPRTPDQYDIRIPLEMQKAIKAAAKAQGTNACAYIKTAVQKQLQKDQQK
jgi:predicted DNA binding CopG/RHH family protein